MRIPFKLPLLFFKLPLFLFKLPLFLFKFAPQDVGCGSG